ncbi:MAG: TRIC cation channel family protein [Actinobacteria bacterium]|nr:TRIC cation channel family protein [Actinomycetota bacterium]
MALDTVLPSVPAWSAYLAVAVGGVAGASHAARRGFDVIGVLGLAAAAGLGGLLLRDVLLQKGTPVVLTDPRYLLSAAFAALLGFFFARLISKLRRLLLGLDALAMGLFVALGASAAIFFGLGVVPAIFLGMVTAIGGGLLRDLLSGEAPAVLRPGIFSGVAALIGAIVFVGLYELGLATFWNQIATIATVFVVRILALWRGWESPTPVDMTDRISHVFAHARVPAFRPHVHLPLHRGGADTEKSGSSVSADDPRTALADLGEDPPAPIWVGDNSPAPAALPDDGERIE